MVTPEEAVIFKVLANPLRMLAENVATAEIDLPTPRWIVAADGAEKLIILPIDFT
jgi:hypothetical protein